MSANSDLHDQAVSHALHLLGYGNAVTRDMHKFINELEDDVVAKLAATLAKGGSDKRIERINATLDEVRNLTTNVYGKAHDQLRTELIAFANAEGQFTTKSINSAVRANLATKLPSPARLKAIVTEDPIHGQILEPWVKGMGEGLSRNIAQQVRLGITQGETIDAITARVKGTAGFEGSRQSARAMVRTAVNHISTRTSIETFRANRDVIKGWMFSATLDSRTTVICASLDGKVFDLDDESALPPRHPQCRSAITAITKPIEEVRNAQKLTGATRASMDGQIPAPTTFDGFMKRKGEAFQNEVLGPTRADLWRRGKLDLSDFVRNYSEVIPLDDLKRLHPEAFVDDVVEAATPAPVPVRPVAQTPTAPDVAALDAETRDRILANGRRAGVEYLEAFDAKTGRIIQDNSGTIDQVVFTPELVRAIEDSRNEIILHHNHPSSSSFSYQDLKMLTEYRGMSVIYAHGHNGSLYRAERGARVLKRNIVDAIGDAVHRGLKALIDSGTISPLEASLIYNHLIWMRIGELDYLKYSFELDGESKAIFDRHRDAFEQILDTMR